jgi:signal transduction histidine kinase
MYKDTDLLKIQVYVGYCHSVFRSRVSYVFGAIIAVVVSLMGLILQKTIDIYTYFFSLIVAGLVFVPLLLFVYRDYRKNLSKVDKMIERVNKGDLLPSVKDMIKGKAI